MGTLEILNRIWAGKMDCLVSTPKTTEGNSRCRSQRRPQSSTFVPTARERVRVLHPTHCFLTVDHFKSRIGFDKAMREKNEANVSVLVSQVARSCGRAGLRPRRRGGRVWPWETLLEVCTVLRLLPRQRFLIREVRRSMGHCGSCSVIASRFSRLSSALRLSAL